jgi:putative restriction endonuclease
MTRDELLTRLAGLRQASVGQVRVPHKPLLLLWLFGQFAATGTSQATYQRAGRSRRAASPAVRRMRLADRAAWRRDSSRGSSGSARIAIR